MNQGNSRYTPSKELLASGVAGAGIGGQTGNPLI